MSSVELSKDGSEIKFEINSNFYSYDAILKAVEDFSEGFVVESEGDRDKGMLITLKNKADESQDLKNVAYEFYNYTLGLMQNGF